MIISLNIPSPLVTRINAVLPRMGYVYNAANTGSTDTQQKQQFVKDTLINLLRDVTIEQEKGLINDAKFATMEATRLAAEVSASTLPVFDTGSIT